MNLQASAHTTALGRKVLVDRLLREGWTVVEAAVAAHASRSTVYKWLDRYEAVL